MRFKHTMSVFADNFSVTYKLLLYRLVVDLIAAAICVAGIYPFISGLINSAQFNSLVDGVKDFALNFFKGEFAPIPEISEQIQSAFASFMELLSTKTTSFIISGLLLFIVHIVQRWFNGLANFATASIVNDKMTLQAKTPLLRTIISNFKTGALYNLIYVPISVIYDILAALLLFWLMYFFVTVCNLSLLIAVYLFILAYVMATVVKMVFTSDWMPALVRGKMTQRQAICYTFSRKNKQTASVFSTYTVLVILVFAANVAAVLLTFGVGLLLTIPGSYLVFVCFQQVNYFDREQIKYFVDEETVVRPATEHNVTREEFFRGEDN